MRPVELERQRIEFIDRLVAACNRAQVNMAVCDMLGRTYQDDDGSFKKITETSPLSVRYELRSKQHVAVYDFKVVYSNYE